jgi:probable HAF family extracellular repeat protein
MYCRLLEVTASVCIAAGLSLGPATSIAQASLLTDLGAGSSAVGINNSGQVLLSSGIYINGTVTVFPASFTGAAAINASGVVAGIAAGFNNGLDDDNAGLYDKGTLTDLGVFSGADPTLDASVAYGINASGQVVGWSATQGGMSIDGFIYSNGVMNDIGALPGNNAILGLDRVYQSAQRHQRRRPGDRCRVKCHSHPSCLRRIHLRQRHVDRSWTG